MRQAAVRARIQRATAGKSFDGRRPSRPGRKRYDKIKWEASEFVAIDGEGFSIGVTQFNTMKSGAVYSGKVHHYAYLSASDGSEIYSSSERLSTSETLNFVCEIASRNPRAIVVVFGGSYDCSNFFNREINERQTLDLIGKGPRNRALNLDLDYSYRLEYQPRKCLTIRRWKLGSPKFAYDEKGNRKLTPHLSVKVWDVWGFFQDSFVGVLKKWLPDDPDFQMIQRMKAARSGFSRDDIETIRVYNAAELRCLVKVMEKLRASINDLGLKINRWDGAGAIAAAMMRKHEVKTHMRETPPEVFDAARRAYSGGHIEVCKMGFHRGAVHHYDINSAYPDQFRLLPSLAQGEWRHGKGSPPSGFTVVKVAFEFSFGLPFYPLFFRADNGSIIYPREGIGWYWFPEYESALAFFKKFGGHKFEPLEYFTFESLDNTRPFEWVETYYSARQDYIAEARSRGVESGPEKVIKTGVNSLYGKTCQQVGARYDKHGELKLPSYFQLEWGGYVTAGCRAKLMTAAIQKPEAIIGFATDGLFSLEPLDLYTPDAKELGAWEYVIHDGITMVMPGVYWLHDLGKVKNYSRGFDKTEMADCAFIHEAWKEKRDAVAVSITRFIGLGSSTTSKKFWKMRGRFVTARRILRLDGKNSKRYSVNLRTCSPELGLVDTMPRGHIYPDAADLESAPYPIVWINPPGEDPESEAAQDQDAFDADLAS